MSDKYELPKVLLALLWLPVAFVVYCAAFGAGMLRIAARDGWSEFK